MKAPEIRYVRPGSIADALSALAAEPEITKVLAGGQSLLPVLNMRLAEPEILLDISKVPELAAVSVDGDGRGRYGACTVHAAFEDGTVPDVTGGLLARTARGIGYRAIRNRGTLGGSLAHADPSAEWPVVMAALGAGVAVRSASGEREIPCAALFDGYFTTTLNDDEIVTAVLVPPLARGSRWGLCKFTRKEGEFAESVAAAVFDGAVFDGAASDGAAFDGASGATARVWLGGAGGTPIRLAALERAVERVLSNGSRPDQQEVVDLVGQDLADNGSAAVEDEYRRHLHGVIAWRALTDAWDRAAPPRAKADSDQESR